MSDQPQVDLTFISRQLDAVLTELGTLRDDVNVLAATVSRLDGTVTGLVQEMQATHRQQDRTSRRLRGVAERVQRLEEG